LQALAGVGAVIAVGTMEGAAVGLAQWRVLQAELPAIGCRAWLVATVAGAVVAWGAGMGIGTLAGDQLEALASGSPVVVAMVIGGAAGTMLSAFQWLVLRRELPNAGWWVPTHALAWSLGMVVAFAGLGLLPPGTPMRLVGVVGAVTRLTMGASVAA
jgi:hypothetical protein